MGIFEIWHGRARASVVFQKRLSRMVKLRRFLPTRLAWLIAACASLAVIHNLARADIHGRYRVDNHTMHLYHFDEPEAPLHDEKSDRDDASTFDLSLLGDAHTRSDSYKGFGTALDTSRSKEAGAFIRTVASSNAKPTDAQLPWPENRATETFWNHTTGAFTVEAIVRLDFDPTVPVVGRTGPMDIVDLENPAINALRNRPYQFGMRPIGVMGATTPALQFVNVSGGNRVQTIVALLPRTGIHAPRQGDWYHVAVTYSGEPAKSGNLKFYWTNLHDSVTEAHLITEMTMNASLTGSQGSLSVGNTSRPSRHTYGCNWAGLLDEVRISDVARRADDFIFFNPKSTSIAVD